MQENINFIWSVANNRITQSFEISGVVVFKEEGAIMVDGTQKYYSEDASWTPASDLIFDSNADGEIWTGSSVKQ